MLSLNLLLPKRLQSGGLVDDLMIITVLTAMVASTWLLYQALQPDDGCRQEVISVNVVVISCPSLVTGE